MAEDGKMDIQKDGQMDRQKEGRVDGRRQTYTPPSSVDHNNK